nr:hypothetical protein [Tanacetum cinerariifolium]
MARQQPHWKVVEHVNHKKFFDEGIMVEEDPDVIHFDNSSDLPLSTSLSDLDDGQSTEVDAPPDIIDLDEDDDIIDDEDALPHDLADFDDDDGMLHGATTMTVAMMIVPLHTIYPPVAGVASLTEEKAPENLIWVEEKRVVYIPARRSKTVNLVFTRDEDRAIYALGPITPSGVRYTEEEINALARKGKQRGHLPGVSRVLPRRATDVLIPPPSPPPQCMHNFGVVEKLKKKNKYLTKQREWRCEYNEMADDEDGNEDEVDEEDLNIDLYLADNARSLGKVARERIPGVLSPSTCHGRHVARDWYSQRQVAREGVKLSLGIV